ncbi:MAG TPA: Gfo/Idh/MocA family oxidoreductase [Solirubrobacteraceae bacterium]|nr:Gfo/Idh/MocA family oxidoreductase [Solirubrobacteraceae bacterium]
MTRPLRAGVAGAGFIGAVHARSARLAGATLAGVATSSPERSREAAERLGAARAYDTPQELATAADIDVLHICTPNHLHAELATLALQHGKHVICEKPLAVSSAQAEELIAAAQAAGRVATVPFVYRFHPVVREARARMQDGSLGPVRLIHGGYLQDWLASAEDDNWRIDADLGGPSRAFADIGSHWCDLVEFMTGDRIAAICAQTSTVFAERADRGAARAFEAARDDGGMRRAVTTEDAVTALFRTAAGVHGTLIVSQVSPGRKNHLHVEIACAEASVRFEQERPETLWLGRREGTETVWRDPTTLGDAAARLAVAPVGHPQGYLDCFDLFVADSYAAVAGEAPDGLPTFADGARSAHLIDAVLASAASGGWVEV